MSFLRKDFAENIFNKHYPALDRIFESAFSRYLDTKDRYDHTARSRASLIHDYIVAECYREFIDSTDIKPRRIGSLFILEFIDENIFMRLKKLDNRYRAANIPTQQAIDFETQEQMILWPNLPPMVYVTAGYVPSADWTKIEKKAVTYMKDGTLRWYLAIDNHKESTVVEIPVENSNINNKSMARVKQDYKIGRIKNEEEGR